MKPKCCCDWRRVYTYCCCCINLKVGCYIIFVVNVLICYMGLCTGTFNRKNLTWLLNRLGFMLELVGCAMLFAGLFFQHCDLLLYYLIAHALCILFATIYNLFWISRCIFCFHAAIISSAGIVINVYCWFIIYLFYRQCRWEQSLDYDPKILPPKKRSTREEINKQRKKSKE